MGLQQAGGGPSERHLGVSPAFDVARDTVPSAFSTMMVQASERRSSMRQAEAADGEDLLQPLQNAARDARFLMLQTPDQVAKAPIDPKSAAQTLGQDSENKLWGDDGFSFNDLLDLINPLQHIPVVATLYRAITNDEIAPGPRMVGGAIYLGGPLGFVSALANMFPA